MNELREITRTLALLFMGFGASVVVFYVMLSYIVIQKATTTEMLLFAFSGFSVFLLALAITRYWKLFNEYIDFYSKMFEEVDKID